MPHDLDDIDADWVGAALGCDVRGVRQAESAGGIPVTSAVSRLVLDVRGAGPESVVVKVPNAAAERWRPLHEREVRFYRELGPETPAPRCLYADIDDESFVLVLEDLTLARPGHRLAGLDVSEALRFVRAVADVHRRFWDDPRLQAWPVRQYDAARGVELASHWAEFWPRFVAGGQFVVSERLAALVEPVGATLADCIPRLGSLPHTLVHCDLHAENLMRDGDRVVVLDWQNASRGHPVLDLVGLVGSTHPDHQAELLARLPTEYVAELGHDVPELAAQLGAAVAFHLVMMVRWLVLFEAETLRDVSTVQEHWARLAAMAERVLGPQPDA